MTVLKHFFIGSSRKSPLRWAFLLAFIMVSVASIASASTVSDRVALYQQYLRTIRPVMAELTPIKRRLSTEPALMTRQHWNALVHQFNLVAHNRSQWIKPYAQQGYQSAQLILDTYQDIEEISAYLSAPTFGQNAQADNVAEWDTKLMDLSTHLNQLEAFYQLEQSISQMPAARAQRF